MTRCCSLSRAEPNYAPVPQAARLEKSGVGNVWLLVTSEKLQNWNKLSAGWHE